jgi:hypothetical protein
MTQETKLDTGLTFLSVVSLFVALFGRQAVRLALVDYGAVSPADCTYDSDQAHLKQPAPVLPQSAVLHPVGAKLSQLLRLSTKEYTSLYKDIHFSD